MLPNSNPADSQFVADRFTGDGIRRPFEDFKYFECRVRQRVHRLEPLCSEGRGQGSLPQTCLSIADWCSMRVARSKIPVMSTMPIAPIAFPSLSRIGLTVTGTPLYAP